MADTTFFAIPNKHMWYVRIDKDECWLSPAFVWTRRVKKPIRIHKRRNHMQTRHHQQQQRYLVHIQFMLFGFLFSRRSILQCAHAIAVCWLYRVHHVYASWCMCIFLVSFRQNNEKRRRRRRRISCGILILHTNGRAIQWHKNAKHSDYLLLTHAFNRSVMVVCSFFRSLPYNLSAWLG